MRLPEVTIMTGNSLVTCRPTDTTSQPTAGPGLLFGTVLGTVDCAKQKASHKSLRANDLRDAHCAKRRGGDSYPPVNRNLLSSRGLAATPIPSGI